MISKLFCGFGLCVMALVAFSCSASAMPADGAVHPEMIVSAKWLSEHLTDPKVIVLHVADKRSEYDKGHIPGARFLALEDFIEALAEAHKQAKAALKSGLDASSFQQVTADRAKAR